MNTNKLRKSIIIIGCCALVLFFLVSEVFSATYYVDYNSGSDSNNGTSTSSPWKYAPGMSGWTGSATISEGDTIILKGGVTWTPISHSVNLWNLSANITVKGGQQLETPWGSGYPVLDGTGATGAIEGISKTNGASKLVIDGIKIYMTEYSPSGGSGIRLQGVLTNIEIKNCFLDHTGDQSFRIIPSDGSKTLLFHDNTTSNVGRFFLAIADENAVDDIQIYNNTFEGTGSWPGGIVGGVHGDGIMIGSECTASNTCLTNLDIHDNKFYGDWAATALIFLNNGTAAGSTQYGGNHVSIYNNQLAIDSDGVISPSYIYVWSIWNDVKIYNNTFGGYYSGSNPVSACINIQNEYSTNIDIKNNIFSGATNSGIIGKAANFSAIDYNIYSTEIVRLVNGWVGTQDCRTTATCFSNFGVEEHGYRADPKFVTLPNGTSGHGDWHIESTSPAVCNGTVLSAEFTTDLEGNTRSDVAWSIGAYEVSVSADGVPGAVTSLKAE